MFNPRIQIVRAFNAENTLQGIWTFWFDDQKPQLILDKYVRETRLSKRHNWKPLDTYSRLYRRNCTISLDAVPFSDDVAREARQQFLELFYDMPVVKKS